MRHTPTRVHYNYCVATRACVRPSCGKFFYWSAMASKVLSCRLCWASVVDKNMTNLFTKKSLERGWASRITALLDVPVSQDDHMPPHVCSKCMTKVVALEKALTELAELKRSALSGMQQVQRSLKRTKETTGEVGVSPDTQDPVQRFQEGYVLRVCE